MRDWSKPLSTLLIGFGLWLFCVFIYLSHIPLNYTYDGMVFASSVEHDNTPLWNFFHPHHLIYTFLGRLLFLWGRAHGADWDGLVTLQFFDLMTGSLGVLIAFHLIVRETNDRLVAALSALGLSFTFSYWYFSTSPGVRIFATVTPLFAWYVLTYQKDRRPLFGICIGAAHALAVLGHQTNTLLIPAFLGGIWLIKEKNAWEKTKISLYYLVSLSVLVLSVYGFVGRFVCYRVTYASWLWWVCSYFHVQQWGGHLEQAGFNQGTSAMIKAFLQETILVKTMLKPFTFLTALNLFVGCLWFLLGAFVVRFRSLWRGQSQTVWVALLWLLAFVPFFIWWEPWNIEFWVSSTAPCWILMALVVSNLCRLFDHPILHLACRTIFTTLWAGVITLLFIYNFNSVAKQMTNPAPQTTEPEAPQVHAHQRLLNALDWKVKQDDLLLLTGINTIPFYIDRFHKTNYLSIHAYLRRYLAKVKAEQKEAEKNPDAHPPKDTDETNDPLSGLDEIIRGQWAKHHKVWVLTEAVDNEDGWRLRLEKLMGLAPGQLVVFFNNYQLTPISYRGKVYFYEVSPQAAPAKVEETPTPAPKTKKGKHS